MATADYICTKKSLTAKEDGAGERDPEYLIIEQKRSIDLLDNYEKLFLSGLLSDLTIISADSKELHVHKVILSISSPVFEKMFEHDMTERKENKVDIEDFNHEVLYEMFRFLYCGKVEKIHEIICDLLRAAEKYSILNLKELCEERMMKSLRKENAIEYLIAADLNKCSNIRKIREFIVENPKDFIYAAEFEALSISHVDLMFKIMTEWVEKNVKD